MQILVLSALCKCLEYRFDAESKILYQFVLFSSLNRRCYTHNIHTMPLFGSPLLLLRTCYPTSLLCQTALSSCWILSELSFRCIWCLGCLTWLTRTQALLTSFHKYTQDKHVPWATQMHAVNTVKSNLSTEINKIIKSQHWTLKYLHSL